jgi:ribonuclease HI
MTVMHSDSDNDKNIIERFIQEPEPGWVYTKVEVFTDGACSGNPGPGGWGAILRYVDGREEEIHGSELHTTNNRMELSAAINALSHLQAPARIALTTDSLYVKDGITKWLPSWKRKNWKTSTGKSVKNIDLWQHLDRLANWHRVSWNWVEAHKGHPENERADKLARRGAKQAIKQK